jgi:hypothetical protein
MKRQTDSDNTCRKFFFGPVEPDAFRARTSRAAVAWSSRWGSIPGRRSSITDELVGQATAGHFAGEQLD